eukprot:6488305-Amphidinium_carterae.1
MTALEEALKLGKMACALTEYNRVFDIGGEEHNKTMETSVQKQLDSAFAMQNIGSIVFSMSTQSKATLRDAIKPFVGALRTRFGKGQEKTFMPVLSKALVSQSVAQLKTSSCSPHIQHFRRRGNHIGIFTQEVHLPNRLLGVSVGCRADILLS